MTVGAIFDCDGVLLDSAHAWRDAEAELGRRAGAVLSVEDKRALAAMTIGEVGSFFHDRFALGSSGSDVVDMIHQIMGEFYSQHAQPIPGIEEFLNGLAAGDVQLSVVSSTQTDFLRLGLKRVGLYDLFCSVLSVEDLQTNKREPLIYRRAMEDMGTTPSTTWGFDDSYYATKTMGALGIATVGVYVANNPCELELLHRYSDFVTCDYSTLDINMFLRRTD